MEIIIDATEVGQLKTTRHDKAEDLAFQDLSKLVTQQRLLANVIEYVIQPGTRLIDRKFRAIKHNLFIRSAHITFKTLSDRAEPYIAMCAVFTFEDDTNHEADSIIFRENDFADTAQAAKSDGIHTSADRFVNNTIMGIMEHLLNKSRAKRKK